MPLEKTIVKNIVDWLNTLPESNAQKVWGGGYTRSGEPDVDACVQGRTVKIEVKQPGRRPTPLQKAALARWKAAGAVTGVATSLDEAKTLLAAHSLPQDGRSGKSEAPVC